MSKRSRSGIGLLGHVARINVKARRKSLDLTLDEVSARINAIGGCIGVTSLSRIETGHRRLTIDDAECLAIALDTTVDRLLDVSTIGDALFGVSNEHLVHGLLGGGANGLSVARQAEAA